MSARRLSQTAGVIVPLRSFALGKARLADALDDDARHAFTRTMAERVVAAAGSRPVVIVSSAVEVISWADTLGIAHVADPGSLDAAARAGREWVRALGLPRLVVMHADLPLATALDGIADDAERAVAVIVPDRHDDGNPVLAIPTATEFDFAYGPGSGARHAAEATRRGLEVRIVRDRALGFDIDDASDLRALEHEREADCAQGLRLTLRVDLATPRRVVAVGAHPDDIEFGCAATLAKWADAGTEVHLVICTDGSKGTWDAEAELPSLVATREEEQHDAAKVLGAVDVRFLHQIDGELTNDVATRAALCAAIREIRPDVILGHDPWQSYRLHPDHRAAGLLTVGAIVAARDPHFFAEQGLSPHRPDTLLLFEAERVDHLERVDHHHVDRKVDALLAHRSQWRSTMAIDETDPDHRDDQRAAFVDGLHVEARTTGLRAGLRGAEAFARVDDL